MAPHNFADSGYPLPVASTWDLSFARLEQEQPAAADLLRLRAFLAPDDIPLSLLRSAGKELPERLGGALGDEIASNRVLKALRGYSLLERRADALHVHRLVQWVVRESLPAERWQQWLAAAVRLLRAVYPGDVQDPERWGLCARVLPQAQAVFRLAEEEGTEPPAISWLMDRAAGYLWSRGDYALARPLFERALAIDEKVLGPYHPSTASTLNNLALLLTDQGELAAARPLSERALAIREKVLGPDHPDTIASRRALESLPPSE